MKYGLIGEKLGHSYSPEIHRAIFELAGLKGEYELIELKRNELGLFLNNAAEMGYAGLNVTIPYKTDVIPFMQDISDEAEKIGAVNTVTLRNGLKGYNTDYFGIKYTFLRNGTSVTGKKVLVAGSGGAAKSVVAFLSDEKAAEIYIASRTPGKIKATEESVIPVSYDDLTRFAPFDIIVNATPVGMFPDTGVSPLKPEHIKGSEFLFDLIYNPAKTRLMEIAESLHIRNVNGLYMLAVQAVKAQEIWNGKDFGMDFADRVYMRLKNLLTKVPE